MEHATLILATIVLYLLAALSFTLRVLREGEGTLVLRAGMGLGLLAVLGHGAVLYATTLVADGLQMGFFNAGSLVAWLMAALVLLAALRMPVENLAVVVLPIGAVALAISALFGPVEVGEARIHMGLKAHVLSSVLAYSVLSIAALQSVVLAWQDYRLRHRQPGGLVRLLPPLRVMEVMLFRMLWLGFAMLSLALATGVVFLEDIFGQHLVHKTTLSIAAWLVFAVLLFGHWQYGWRGRTAIRWTLGGFFALMLAYFGTKLVLELILGR